MDRHLRLSGFSPTDRGFEQIFYGWSSNREPVRLHIPSSQWNSIRAAEDSSVTPYDRLELLARSADWMPNAEHGGWTVHIRLPMLMGLPD